MNDAFRIAAIGTRDDVIRAAATSKGAANGLLRAVIAQFDGDVDGATRLLRRLIASASPAERAPLADALAPIYVMRHRNADVEAMADVLAAGGWAASAFAFRALSAADTSRRHVAAQQVLAAEAALAYETDDVVRLRVLHRLARAAYFLGNHERALDFALASAAICVTYHAWRSAAANYSIAFSVHLSVLRDDAEALRFAKLWQSAAERSGDESFVQAALVAEYEVAVRFADDVRIADLDRRIKARLLPEQYTERFPLALSNALATGARDAVGMRSILEVLRSTPDRTPGEWALCTGLIAVADAATHDDDRARANLRAAVSRLGRPRSHEPPYEYSFRRLARVALSAACVLLGDDVRADRILGVREMAADGDAIRLPASMRAARWHEITPRLRGFARVFEAASAKRRSSAVPADLTEAEFAVLGLLAAGWPAARIAEATQRSVHTVYSHTRSILTKLDAKRAPEAVAAARERGIIT